MLLNKLHGSNSRVLLDILTVKKFPVFYGTRRLLHISPKNLMTHVIIKKTFYNTRRQPFAWKHCWLATYAVKKYTTDVNLAIGSTLTLVVQFTSGKILDFDHAGENHGVWSMTLWLWVICDLFMNRQMGTSVANVDRRILLTGPPGTPQNNCFIRIWTS
jgi:hypothetical protein